MKVLWPRLGLSTLAAAVFAVGSFLIAPAPAQARQAETITEDDIISGTMDITFETRTKKDTTGDLKKDSPALGATDLYKMALRVAKTTEFAGEIKRQPNLYSSILARKKQEAKLFFRINLAVLKSDDPKQRRDVGKWVGEVPIDTATGAYDLAGGAALKDPSPLRIDIDTIGKQTGFKSNFSGRLIGKAESKDNLASYTYKRLVGKKEVQIVVKKSDPMNFSNITLAKGPAEIYPATTVSGRLDYDYETGNWFTDGVRMHYSLDGKEYDDVITGSIKWVEDKDRATNGKGYYEFNLRFNEDKNKKATTENAAFDKLSDEDAFFAVDNSIPCLTGRVEYVDTMSGSGENAVPTSSKVTYHLNANKLNKQQVMNFFKLWVVCVGPTNDE